VENTIRLAEEETFEGDPCLCLCCYDVEATVAGLPSGPYNVEYCWTDEELPVERCHYASIVIP
ncbi:MAG: hypothetical protein KJ749_10370, partial [Planctomycetes bacterium]|nr:hypothetical protein [Planctomycetota bacterium]